MSVEVSEKLYRVAEFLNLDLPDDQDYELIGGKPVGRPKSGTSAKHGKIVGKLSQKLNNYLDTQRLGVVYVESSCNLGQPDGSNYVKPDVCFVVGFEEFTGAITVAPDLVVEVISPSDTSELIQDKLEIYQQAGVKLVWTIYMLQKFVAVYRLGDPDTRLLNLKGELDGEDILPGFQLAVKELFD